MRIHNINKTSVVFIPNYLVAALKANGISLSELEAFAMAGVDIKDTLGRLSVYDLIDLYTANDQLFRVIIGSKFNEGQVAGYVEDNLYSYLYDRINIDKKQNYLNLITNLNTNISILVSDNNNELYTFEICEHTLFVILHTGFGDLIVGNNNEKREAFNKELVDKVFRVYGEQAGNINSVTKMFIGKVMAQPDRHSRR